MKTRNRFWTIVGTLCLATIITTLALGRPVFADTPDDQPSASEEVDPWAPLELLIGTWQGAVNGKLGTGKGLRRYERIIGDKYILMRHSSVRLPQEKSPKGDQHEELSVFSFDKERGKIVLREFMIEGVVTLCVCEMQPKSFVCTSESVESGPGIRSRLTIEIESRYRFREIYELAFPGNELSTFFNIEWTRIPELD